MVQSIHFGNLASITLAKRLPIFSPSIKIVHFCSQYNFKSRIYLLEANLNLTVYSLMEGATHTSNDRHFSFQWLQSLSKLIVSSSRLLIVPRHVCLYTSRNNGTHTKHATRESWGQ